MGGETAQKVKSVNAKVVEPYLNKVEGGLKDLITRIETGDTIRPIEYGLLYLLPIGLFCAFLDLPLTPWVFAIIIPILMATSNQTELTLLVLGILMQQLYATMVIEKYCVDIADAKGLVLCGNAGCAWFAMVGACGWMVLYHLKLGGRTWWGWGKPY